MRMFLLPMSHDRSVCVCVCGTATAARVAGRDRNYRVDKVVGLTGQDCQLALWMMSSTPRMLARRRQINTPLYRMCRIVCVLRRSDGW